MWLSVWFWGCHPTTKTFQVNTLRRRQKASISQTIFSNAFSWIEIYEFRSILHWGHKYGYIRAVSCGQTMGYAALLDACSGILLVLVYIYDVIAVDTRQGKTCSFSVTKGTSNVNSNFHLCSCQWRNDADAIASNIWKTPRFFHVFLVCETIWWRKCYSKPWLANKKVVERIRDFPISTVPAKFSTVAVVTLLLARRSIQKYTI